MKRPNLKFFDDVSGLAGGAVNIASALRHQIKNDVRARLDELITQMDLVPRADLNDLQHQIEALQNSNAELKSRLEKLEKPKKKKGQ